MTNTTDEQPQHDAPMLKPHGLLGGTPVHTRDGLVTIDQLKVGDWVLSKPESRVGEVAYKRVLSTMAFDETEIWCVAYSSEYLFASAGHRFWVAERNEGGSGGPHQYKVEKWFALEELDTGFYLLLGNGVQAYVSGAGPVCKMRNSDQGAVVELKWDNFCSTKVDFSGDYPKCSQFDEHVDSVVCAEKFDGSIDSFSVIRRKVYNIKVEDHHSYFVGKAGVWVHSTPE